VLRLHAVRLSLQLAILGAFAASGFAAIAPRQGDDGAVPLPNQADPLLRGPFAEGPPLAKADRWADFSARHGGWDVLWNEWTATPQRAIGKAIQVAGPIGDVQRAHGLALDFLRAESGITKASSAIDLRERSTVKAGRVWYAHFRQFHQGVEILNSNTTVRLDQDGRIMAFGSDVRDDIQLSTQPLLSVDDARVRAREGLQFDFNSDNVSGGEHLYILPLDHAVGSDYALVRHLRVSQASPPHEWETFVDAHDGEVRWRQDRVRYGSVTGNVTGEIRVSSPNDPVIIVNLKDVGIDFGAGTTFSDASGNYAFAGVSGTQTLHADVDGRWADVFRVDNPVQGAYNAGIDADTDPVVTVDLVTGANPTETNAYYHTTLVHDYIKGVDPAMTAMDFAMTVNVNIDDSCNAFWDGTSINFFKRSAPDDCNNTVYVSDVVYHEWGHGLNDRLYLALGSLTGMNNGALHEGMADVLATLMEDDSELGQGFYISTPVGIRNVDNTNRYPEDNSGEVHNDGLIIGGAFWDLRQLVGLSTAEQLSHFAKYGLPDGGNKVAFQTYFIETLVADDDNGDLSDGTPHWNEIITAFNLHGIGPSLFLTIVHTALGDTSVLNTPRAIDALLTTSSTLFTLNPSTAQVVYSVDGLGEQTAAMSLVGGENYTAAIPGVGNGHLIRYRIEAGNFEGETLVHPLSAPLLPHSFLVGQQLQISEYDFEVAGGWTVGDVDDTATTGLWARVEPFGTFSGSNPVQPQLDNSSAGTLCFITGNNHGGDPTAIGADDVDGGKTTLFSPIFDLTATFRPVIRYYRWYTNNLGASPGQDFWRVDISNDGGSSWSSVENTAESAATWKKVMFLVENFITPTNNMQLRFIADDAGNGSVVEAGVDDVEILHFLDLGTGTNPPLWAPSSYTLAQNEPNPFNPTTEIRFDLPRSGRVQLRVYDLAGRLVRTLVDGPMTAGAEQRVIWNGRDGAGRMVSSGVYLYRLQAAEFEQTKRMVLLK